MLSLEHVDLMYSQHGLKPWNSSKWVPPGYITRRLRDDARSPLETSSTDREKSGSDGGDGVREERKEHA